VTFVSFYLIADAKQATMTDDADGLFGNLDDDMLENYANAFHLDEYDQVIYHSGHVDHCARTVVGCVYNAMISYHVDSSWRYIHHDFIAGDIAKMDKAEEDLKTEMAKSKAAIRSGVYSEGEAYEREMYLRFAQISRKHAAEAREHISEFYAFLDLYPPDFE
jgi:hypothetical protein